MIQVIKYEKLLPTGAYLNEKIGFEVSVDFEPTNENVLLEIERLRILAEQSHKEKYPHLYTESGSPIETKQVEDEPINTRIQTLINDINNCTVVDEINAFGAQVGLIAFEGAANSNEEIRVAYDFRMKQLLTI